MTKIYKINRELNEHGFYTISENCINGEFYRFNELLKSDHNKLIKSAICNWFENKHGRYVVAFNGNDCIYLQSEKTNEIEEIYYQSHFQVYDGYLIYYDDWKLDYYDKKDLIHRYIKINKLKELING